MPRIRLENLEFEENIQVLNRLRAFDYQGTKYKTLSSISLIDTNPDFAKLFEIKSPSGDIFYGSIVFTQERINGKFPEEWERRFYLMTALRDDPNSALEDSDTDRLEGEIELLKIIKEFEGELR